MFADDLILYHEVVSIEDCQKLQQDLSQVYEWSLSWLLHLHPKKCEVINITNKRNPITVSYFVASHSISWMQKVKYLGVYVTSKLDWLFQCRHAASRAMHCLFKSPMQYYV